MKYKTTTAVSYWPRATSQAATLPAGTLVDLVRKESATLLLVSLPDKEETILVAASEVEALEPQTA